MDILTLLHSLGAYLMPTTLRQMAQIVTALLTMTGRITMLGISRWTSKGGSYRTVQRFYNTPLPWAVLFWCFFRVQLYQPTHPYLLVGDECIVPKAGKATHGLGRFFASLYRQPIPGLAFFALSLVNTHTRQSHPLQVEQMVGRTCGKAAVPKRGRAPAPQVKPKRPVGRPKGSKNKDKTQVRLTPELHLIQNMLRKQLLFINGLFKVSHLALDGHFGHNKAVQMVRQCYLHLVSKLRHDAALYFQYDGPQAKTGPRRKYGDKIAYTHLPPQYRKASYLEGDIQTDYYQALMLHKAFAQLLNVVIIVKTNRKTRQRAHVVLFSSDVDLAYAQLVEYYRLRFQIEFNFRDAKQYWGLDDFMNIKATPVTNAANLALFMVNVSQGLLHDLRQWHPQASVLDLKAIFHGRKYVTALLELLPEKPDPIVLQQLEARITALGQIHPPTPGSLSP